MEGRDGAGSKLAKFSSDPVLRPVIVVVATTVFAIPLFFFFFGNPSKPSNSSGDLLLTPSDVIRREQDQKLQEQIDGLNKKLQQIVEQQSVNPTPSPTPSANK
jgi:hypothetical protein